jgi:DNA-binding MarR family transcriptional regulator
MVHRSGDQHPLTGYLVWHLSLKWRAAVDRALAPLDFTHAQYVLLASLHGQIQAGKHPSQRELAEFSGIEPMYVSRLARTLEQQGLLARGVHPDDPRARILTLTDLGERRLAVAMERVRELHDTLVEPIANTGDDRLSELTATLQVLLRHVRGLDHDWPGTFPASEK